MPSHVSESRPGAPSVVGELARLIWQRPDLIQLVLAALFESQGLAGCTRRLVGEAQAAALVNEIPGERVAPTLIRSINAI